MANFTENPHSMRFFTSLLCCFCLTVSGTSQMTVLELLSASPSSSHFSDIVTNNALTELLTADSDLTILVPNNDAIDAYAAAMGMSTAEFIGSESAVEMARYHIVPEAEVAFNSLTADSIVTTALGMSMSFHVNDMVNATTVAAVDLEASNGVMHILDEVVVLSDGIYQWLDASSQHNYLSIAVDFLGLDEVFSAIGTKTVFAPTDAALLAYTEANGLNIVDVVYNPTFVDVLLHHSLSSAALTSAALLEAGNVTADSGEELFFTSSGETVHVNTAAVLNADILTQNGHVHVVDEVIMPMYFLSDAIADAGLTLLDSLLTLTGVMEELSFPANYTVFAPTDSAITAFLDAEELTIDELLLDVEGLSEGLLAHVADDYFLSTDLVDGDLLMTLAGVPLLVEVGNESIQVGGGEVVAADIAADNGVLHLVEDVLTPYIQGCTNEEACNYDDDATVDDGSCYELEVITSWDDNACAGGADGVIYVEVSNAPDAILLGDYQGQQVFESEDGVFSGLLSGTYVIHVEDTAGCTTAVSVDIDDVASTALTVMLSATPDDGSGNGTVMAVPSGGIPPYTVVWYDEAMNESGDVYLPAGTYTATITDEAGCTIEASVTVESSVDVADFDNAPMVLYPNPTRGTIEITNLPAGWTSIHVLNVAGREMLAMQPLATGSLQWDASDWPVGVYFVQVVSEDGTSTERFTVIR